VEAKIKAAHRPGANAPRLRLRVTATAETLLRGGHPWLFANSVREQNRPGTAGELAVIFDRNDAFLAVGLYDPDSPIRARILHAGKPVTINESWWRGNLQRALDRRAGMFDAQTNAHRWINGESDGWPGLVLDRYADALVLKLYTAIWLPRLEEVTRLIRETLKPERLILRFSRNIQALARQDFQLEDGATWGATGSVSSPDLPPAVIFQETGLRFEAEVVRGQKTGFFLDQRDNRRRVEAHARAAEVLNAFSFSGGFSLYAARGGAKSVTDLDISAHALDSARRNFQLNQAEPTVAACRHETVQADAFLWLELNATRAFDVVILDPPSLAKRESERAGAIQAYAKLAANGLKALRPGGLLVAASCSAHVTADEFFEAVRSTARRLGCSATELATTGHPADHPATFPEAQYLKCIYLRTR
jgi:23S rRNA (cytosine1962-C5)-methyltransferase